MSSQLIFSSMSYRERKSWHSATLDTNSCVNLQQVLDVFSAAVSEEQAWAVLYQVSPIRTLLLTVLFAYRY